MHVNVCMYIDMNRTYMYVFTYVHIDVYTRTTNIHTHMYVCVHVLLIHTLCNIYSSKCLHFECVRLQSATYVDANVRAKA